MPGAVVVRIQVDFSVSRRPEVASCCRLPDSQLRACAVTLCPVAHRAGVGQRLHGPPAAGGGPGPSSANGTACVPCRLLHVFSSASAARPGKRQGRPGFDKDRAPSRRRAGIRAAGRRAGPVDAMACKGRGWGTAGRQDAGPVRLASAAWPRIGTWPQAPRRSTTPPPLSRCRTRPPARPTPLCSSPCRSLA